jgi:radical SAM/Cys-rich protein
MINHNLEELTCIPGFANRIDNKEFCLTNDSLSVLQVNIGRVCNLSCKHCHLEAGPDRTESMNLETMQDCLQVFWENSFTALDITGGSPEMNPHFEWLVQEASALGRKVVVRSNLVILQEKEYRHLPEFYARHNVEIVCSLPYYNAKDVNRQRGEGVFEESVFMLQELNKLGYGKKENLVVNLVYNPGGAFLPPSQAALEAEYKRKLQEQHDIVFNHLFTITNNPVGRFGLFLHRSNELEGYMTKLSNSFNADTLPYMMCRDQLSVDWDGRLYDCDYNQAFGWTVEGPDHISMLKEYPIQRARLRK